MAGAVFGSRPEAPIAGLPPFSHAELILRPATAADRTFCRDLFHEDRGPLFFPLNLDPVALAALLDQQYGAQQAAFRQAFPDAEDGIVDRAGDPVGRLTSAWIADDKGPSLHVVDLLLSVRARNQGIGTKLLNGLHQAALAKGAGRLTLSVLRENIDARRLYGRLGFVAVEGGSGARVAMIKPLK